MIFTWDKNWRKKDESIWCTLEKFQLANNVDYNTLIKLFEIQSPNKIHQYNRNIFTAPPRLNHEMLNNAFQEDLFNVSNTEIQQALGSLYNPIDFPQYFRDCLTWCPKCMESGYHSIWHQIIFMDKCFIHNNQELIMNCPKCGRKIDFLLDNTKRRVNPFSCTCGYSFFDKSFTTAIKIWSNEDINLKHIYSINRTHQLIPSHTFKTYNFNAFYNKEFSISEPSYYPNSLMHIAHSELDSNLFKYTFVPSLTHESLPIRDNGIIDLSKLDYTVRDIFIQQYKVLSRFILNKYPIKKDICYIQSHRISLVLSNGITKTPLLNKNISEYAYAYLMWKKEVAGYDEYYEVDKPYTNIRFKTVQDVKRNKLTNSIIFNFFYAEMNKYLLLCRDYPSNEKGNSTYDYGIFISILERVMALTLKYYFISWLEYIRVEKKHAPNEIINVYHKLKPNIPIILATYIKESKKAYVAAIDSKTLFNKEMNLV